MKGKNIFIILAIFILLMLLIFGSQPSIEQLFMVGVENSGEHENGNGSKKIVEVALAEMNERNNGGQKFWSYIGFPGRVAWCASFVSWCANECGYIDSKIIPNSAWCNDFRDFYKSVDRWKNGKAHGGDYIPKEGDLILIQWSGSTIADLDHIGIVTDSDGVTVSTIEGNSSDAVRTKSYSIDHQAIIGYGLPNYPASSNNIGTLKGATNAEKIYHAFISTGYTREASAAIVGNLAGEGGTDANGDIVLNSVESNGVGVGIVQWSFDRKTAFLAFAALKGESWPNTSLGVQLQYMIQELETNQWLWSSIGAEYGNQYNISYAQFKQCNDVEFATTAFCANFERCHAYNSGLNNRIAYAKRVLNSFGK